MFRILSSDSQARVLTSAFSFVVAHVLHKEKHCVLDGHPVPEQGHVQAERLLPKLRVGPRGS